MGRPSESTRQNLIDAATDIFAEHGFEGGSVRLITRRAGANQAAINYHFGDKEGLYREVLRSTLRAFEASRLTDESEFDGLTPAEELRLFLHEQLVPLTRRDEFSRFVQIFAWEGVRPSRIMQELMAGEPLPLLSRAERIVRRYVPPDASEEDVAIVTAWLVQQPMTFVRDADFLSRAPFSFDLDDAFVERLTSLLCHLAHGALSALAAARPTPSVRRDVARSPAALEST